ncbi:M4 family metallopeptidase [Streptomyces sp. NPDC002688]|uniref:M4 family metallopeptidase n=1 Tax=Streptomyces sp. NPDC002688 TaxID=3154423 RepID=UPI003331B038
MDIALITTLIGAVAGGIVTFGGTWLHTRTSVRTAARLIYAELTRDSTAVAYFRQTGHWAAPTLNRAAWDSQGALLARRRSSATFEAVHRGYAALEIVPFIADDTLSAADRGELLDWTVERLTRAISAIGEVAQVPKVQVRDWTRRLEGAPLAGRTSTHPLLRSGVIPLSLYERLTEEGGLQLTYQGLGWRVTDGELTFIGDGSPPEDVQHIVFEARWGEELDRLPVARATGDEPVGDSAVDETYDGLVATSRFLREVFGREYLLDPGLPVPAVVHYGRKYNNGFWNGSLLVLGDGDDQIFSRFSQCLEVVGAELMKAMIQQTDLVFHGQPGAIINSLCDVFGVMVKQYALGQSVEEADWLLGVGLLAPGINGVALRSLKEPGTAYDNDTLGRDPQPATMDHYLQTERNNGGTHINSGIPNRAFYLVAERLGGKAWERAGWIWWDVLTGGELAEETQFADFARLTVAAALNRYGQGEEHQAVVDAWSSVGLPTDQVH